MRLENGCGGKYCKRKLLFFPPCEKWTKGQQMSVTEIRKSFRQFPQQVAEKISVSKELLLVEARKSPDQCDRGLQQTWVCCCKNTLTDKGVYDSSGVQERPKVTPVWLEQDSPFPWLVSNAKQKIKPCWCWIGIMMLFSWDWTAEEVKLMEVQELLL